MIYKKKRDVTISSSLDLQYFNVIKIGQPKVNKRKPSSIQTSSCRAPSTSRRDAVYGCDALFKFQVNDGHSRAFFCSLHKTIANRIKVVASILPFLRFVYPIFTVCLRRRRSSGSWRLCPCFQF